MQKFLALCASDDFKMRLNDKKTWKVNPTTKQSKPKWQQQHHQQNALDCRRRKIKFKFSCPRATEFSLRFVVIITIAHLFVSKSSKNPGSNVSQRQLHMNKWIQAQCCRFHDLHRSFYFIIMQMYLVNPKTQTARSKRTEQDLSWNYALSPS